MTRKLLAPVFALVAFGCSAVSGLADYELSPIGADAGPSPPPSSGTPATPTTTPPPPSASRDAAADAPPDPCAPCGRSAVRSVCVANACEEARRVFVTSEMTNGAAGGDEGADVRCEAIASAAGLGGQWRAWVSDSGASQARDRLEQSAVPYRLLDGTLVASSFTDLVDGTLAHAIDLEEHGARVPSGEVWTGTRPDGTAADNKCDNFTDSTTRSTGRVGLLTATNDLWTSASVATCDQALRTYCFEQ